MNERPFTTIDVPVIIGQKVRINDKGPYAGEIGEVDQIIAARSGILVRVLGTGSWTWSYICPLGVLTGIEPKEESVREIIA